MWSEEMLIDLCQTVVDDEYWPVHDVSGTQGVIA